MIRDIRYEEIPFYGWFYFFTSCMEKSMDAQTAGP